MALAGGSPLASVTSRDLCLPVDATLSDDTGRAAWRGSGCGGGGGGGGEGGLWEALQRPDINNCKTHEQQWQALHSRWRWLHAVFFYIGPPAHILSRVWPVLLLNMLPILLVCADHIVRVMQTEAVVAQGRRALRSQLGLLPDLSAGLSGSLESLFRYLFFAVTMLLTLRLQRVYDRWWMARQEFEAVGNAVVGMVQRLGIFIGSNPEERKRLEDLQRWGVVWQYAVMQACTGAEQLHPAAARLLHPDELALYNASREGRQLAVNRYTQLMAEAPLEAWHRGGLDAFFHKGMIGANQCIIIKFQAMPSTLSLVAAGFTEIFLLLMPLTLEDLDQDHSGNPADRTNALFSTCILIMVTMFVNLLILGADETATRLEDPFPSIPMAEICASTAADSARALDEATALRGAPPRGRLR